MMKSVLELEAHRLAIQAELDAAKGQAERNRMGQFATPPALAAEILQYAKAEFEEVEAVRFIDPAIGTGAFYSALLRAFPESRLARAVGYEVDPHYGEPAIELWNDTLLNVHLDDFTLAGAPDDGEKFNLLICNPPYVRHHHIPSDVKRRLQSMTWESCRIKVNGLAGLYCYFLGISHKWMADGGLAGWLIPSEFMDVNYGAAIKRYLLDEVTLLHIHRFDPNDVQFGDALVSSAVVWFRKRKPRPGHLVRMAFGGSLLNPRTQRLVSVDGLRSAPKWTQYSAKDRNPPSDHPVLADFFTIKRGLATGSNRYFIRSKEEINERGLPIEVFAPILPSPRYLPVDEVSADGAGNPILERQLFLLDCRLTEDIVKEKYPILWNYFEEGKAQGVAEKYICRHRSPWYAQERRPAAPFLCTYLGRSDKKSGRPFRFILNHSNATAPNVYLMLYPIGGLEKIIAEAPQLKRQVWNSLNSIGSEQMLSEGRVYGGGLHKMEPKELGRVSVSYLTDLLAQSASVGQKQLRLLETTAAYKSFGLKTVQSDTQNVLASQRDHDDDE